jgi:2-oxo-4-hydroxy-4-carboxy--5-ureidoimidazoline (OHCU) decarboxylase
MANRNPWKARLAKALRAKPLSIADVLKLDSAVLVRAYLNVVQAADPEDQRKHILAYATISGKLAKQQEVGEIESRLLDLEQSMAERNGHR